MSFSGPRVAHLRAVSGVSGDRAIKAAVYRSGSCITYAVLIGHEYLQHCGCGWRDTPNLQCNTYVISSTQYVKDAVEFAYGTCFLVVRQPAPGLRPNKV